MSEVIALQRWMPDIAEREVFLCGPSTWTDGMERLFLAAGVPTDPHPHRKLRLVNP
jgi:ferredoxin-NADP reductase